jgi:hypothetical protein
MVRVRIVVIIVLFRIVVPLNVAFNTCVKSYWDEKKRPSTHRMIGFALDLEPPPCA